MRTPTGRRWLPEVSKVSARLAVIHLRVLRYLHRIELDHAIASAEVRVPILDRLPHQAALDARVQRRVAVPAAVGGSRAWLAIQVEHRLRARAAREARHRDD